MNPEAELIKGCREFKESAQKNLYLKFAGKMKAVCMRYCPNEAEAEDILHEGFIKVFVNFNKFSESGSLEGWIKRTMINTAISNYKKRKKEKLEKLEDVHEDISDPIQEEQLEEFQFSQEELMKALNSLPENLNIVFNLYYLDNNSHKEIGLLLGIDETTSRARLSRARKKLREDLLQMKQSKRGFNLFKILAK